MASVVVVGAGLGGLAAAARLAAGGHDVTVCEQADRVGGKLGLAERDGFRFDTGPSLLTMPDTLRRLLADTGGPHPGLELVPVEPLAHYRFGDGAEVDLWSQRARTASALDASLGAGAGADWLGLLDRGRAMWRAVSGPFLQSPLAGPPDLVRLAGRVRDLPVVAPHRTLRQLGRSCLRDPRLRLLLDRYATYTGSDPRRAPAALAVVPYAEQAFGAWYVPGGLHRIAEVVRERAERHGARVRTGADVVAVEARAGRVAGVRLACGERLPAEVVVANADASMLYDELLPGGRGTRVWRRLRRAVPSLSGFVMLLGVRGRTGVGHHTVLFGERYDDEFDALFGSAPRPVPDPTLYLSVPADPGVAPPGHEAWFVLVNAPRHGQGLVDWDARGLAERYADRLLELLADRGLDLSGRIMCRELRTPADLQRRARAPGGAIYGSSSNSPRSAFLRPPNRALLPGLFLAGGSAHPGGGLPLVLTSARLVADLVGRA